MVTIEEFDFKTLQGHERSILRRLTLRDGLMWDEALECDIRAWRAILETGKVVGWVLLSYGTEKERLKKGSIKPRMMLYVQRAYRKQGIGRQLVEAVKSIVVDPRVYTHDRASMVFYYRVGLKKSLD